jgi:cobalt/nickel transport system permease protein
LASWFSVLLAALAFAVELSYSGYAFAPTFSAVLLIHVFIGVGEAIITGLVVAYLLRARPDLVYGADERGRTSRLEAAGHLLVGGLAIALITAIFLSPFASDLPDGLEWAAAKLGVAEPNALFAAPLLDYQFPGLAEHAPLATSVAGLVGTLVVFAVALVIGRSLWRVSSKDAAHAA